MKTNSAEQVGQSRKYGQNDPPDQANSSKRQRLSDTTSATDKLQNDLNNKDKKIAQLEASTLLLLLTREPSLEQFYSKVSTTEMEKNQTNQEKVSKLEQLNSLLNAKNTAITGRIQMLESQNNTYAIELNQKNVLVEQQAAEIQQIQIAPTVIMSTVWKLAFKSIYWNSKNFKTVLICAKPSCRIKLARILFCKNKISFWWKKAQIWRVNSKQSLMSILNLKKQYDDKLKNITELKISKNKIESRMVALRAQNFKLEDKQKSNDVQINNLKVINEDLDNQLRASHAKNAELEKQQQNNPKRTEELETVIKNLRSKLKVVNAKLSTGVNQNQHFLITVGQLSESTINLEKRFKLAIETLTELQEYRQKSMESAAQLETANKNLQNMLDETKTKLLESEKKNQHYMRMQGTSENEATTSEQRDPDSTQSPQKAQDPLNEAILKYIENGREQVKKIKSDTIEMSSSQNEQKHRVVSN
ncbi:hypothetical protein M3Y97_00721700 [Aphelenchoides bicaudatus]|nr:hypothetical protein M3Y97_00721700 [Aphelenchoides bicaudatus]